MKNILLSFALCLFAMHSLSAQITIAEARVLAQGTTDITIQGIVTNGDELGPIRYIQDSTGAIPIYDPPIGETMQPGDEVTVTGEMSEFNGLIQLVSLSDSGILSSGNPLPAPVVLTPSQVGADYEGMLATVENVTFVDGGGSFSQQTFEFTNLDGESSVIYLRNDNPLSGTLIPINPVNLTGIVSVFSGAYQLLPRSTADIEFASSFYVTSPIAQSEILTDGFTVQFDTNLESTPVFRIGLTPDFESGDVLLDVESSSHSYTFTGLEPAEFYYVSAYATNDMGQATTNTGIFSTASNSTGEVKVFFNSPVDNSVSTGTDAIGLSPGDFEEVILDFIAGAESTLDVAVYNNNRAPIVAALNDAVARGVVVRYVYDNGTLNSALQQGVPNFQNIAGNTDGLMHNKFIVRDADSVTGSWVLGGSCNFTDTNIVDDYNNLILVQDQALAKAYTWEFNEMWGTDGPSPAIFSLAFGDQKTNNTPHKFMVNGMLVENYFSPSDNVTQVIVDAMASANSTMEYAVLSFTHNPIGTAARDAANLVDERALMENIGDQGTEYDFLVGSGVNILAHSIEGQIHHKYLIVDADAPDSDPILLTGSHNWSAGAESRNDENIMVFHSAEIANIYLQEFSNRWCEMNGGQCVTTLQEYEGVGVGLENDPTVKWKMYPVPASDYLTLEFMEKGNWTMSVTNMLGQEVLNQVLTSHKELIDLSELSQGSYLLTLQDGQRRVANTFTVQ